MRFWKVRIPAQPLSRKLAGEGGCRRDSPGQGTAPSPECADKNSLPGTFPAGCLCHFRRGLCHGADCSPESTGCDSQLTFSINPLFCGPSSGTSRGTVFFMRRVSAILEPENGGGDDDAEYAAGPGDSGGGADLRRVRGRAGGGFFLHRRTAGQRSAGAGRTGSPEWLGLCGRVQLLQTGGYSSVLGQSLVRPPSDRGR